MNYDQNTYELLLQQEMEELKSVGYLFRHKKSGARVALISNDDENKVFSIGFRTPPSDSTGVPHILEHSVLCGSDKYPVKDPFIELAKGSLNTFLNAMTYPDKTVYPIASCNDADFKNLMDVYMDATLHPLISSRKEVFLQEGWHYEMEDKDSPLTYNGVVYNEMKGAFSSPDDVLARYCLNSLYPDTSYGTESGGDPKCIPDLTYEQFVNFHKKLYHPSNSYIYIYGNCDMTERLEYLDREYLSKYDVLKVDSELKVQASFDSTRRVETEYSVTEETGTDNKTYLAYNFSISRALDIDTIFGFNMLDYALFSAPGAPVKQALIDAGIGDDVYSSFDDGINQPMLSIVAKNARPDQEEEFIRIIRETLTDLVKNGVNRQTLEAGINSDEFRYREADFGRFPKGLMYGLNMMSTWLYDEEKPFERIALNKVFEFLKEKLNTRFYEELIEKYILNNTHSSIVVLNPVVNLASKTDAETAQKLAEYKASLSEAEIEEIVKQTAALKTYQSEPSTEEELLSIPLLKREDISRVTPPVFNDIRKLEGVTVDLNDIYTNGIGYLNVGFNIQNVADEDIPYMGILLGMLGYISTDAHSYDELSNEIDIHTGGVSTDFNSYRNFYKEAYTHLLQIKSKALVTKFDKVFELIEEIMYTSHFEDHKRMREVLAEMKSGLQAKLMSAGHGTAIGVVNSQMCESGRISELYSGIAFYEFISDILDNYDAKKALITEKLELLSKQIFSRENMIVNITVAADEYALLEDKLAAFIRKVPENGYAPVERKFTYEKIKLGYKTAGQVNYVARMGDFSKSGFEYVPALGVLRVIMGYDYLWNNIRVLGGAYGCMSGSSREGRCHFVSYRDPNVRRTNEVYEGVPEFLKNFDISEREMTKFIIGTFSDVDVPMTPSAKGLRSFGYYMTETPFEFLQKNRIGMLETNPEDIRALAPLIQSVLDDGYFAVIGSVDGITKDADLFDEIRTFA